MNATAKVSNLGNKFVVTEIVMPESDHKKNAVRQPVNMIWIYDRSGSMYSTINGLVADMIRKVDHLSDGDSISVGWFSTEGGQFDFLVKGVIVSEESKKLLVKILERNKTVIGLTCFSEILEKTSTTLMSDLSEYSGTFSLMFMTDGYPVVKNYQNEIKQIFTQLESISKRISSAMIVGYGSYYNKELLSKMSERLGASLVHSSHIDDFSNQLFDFTMNVPVLKRVEIPLPVLNPLYVCTFDGGSIVRIPVEIKNSSTAIALVSEDYSSFYVLADQSNIHDFTHYSGTDVFNEYDLYTALMSLAYVAVGDTKTDVAIDILSFIGDVCVIDAVNNSWTNEEYGKTQDVMLKTVINEDFRYYDGKQLDYVPSDNAFCLMDALSLLMNDEYAFFYPRHSGFEYNRIGAKTKELTDLEFVADTDTACSFGNLTWNKKRLNLSLLAKINGYVSLPDDCEKVGLKKNFSCFKYRNYTIVKDGILNIQKLPVSMSEPVFNTLRDSGMIDFFEVWDDGEVYIVDFTAVPIVNRVLVSNTTASAYCELADRELEYEFRLNFLKKKLKQLDETGIISSPVSEFTPEQESYLENLGIKADRTFSPKVQPVETEDYYIAKEFNISVSKFSSIPKVDDVLQKMANGKHTPSSSLMASIINDYEIKKPNGSVLDEIIFVKESIKFYNRNLVIVRNKMNFTKFGLFLSKRWFSDLTERDGAVVDHNGKTFTFSIRDVNVKY